jgi:ADP-ribosylglycohydrolase
MNQVTISSRVRGSLLGGAIGDALGAPVEFMSAKEIESLTDNRGVHTFLPMFADGVEHTGVVTDDTQMTLFTMEGIIRALTRMNLRGLGFTNGVIHHAYLRWADTQIHTSSRSIDGWLGQQQWLYSRRAPGTMCLEALAGGTKANRDFGAAAVNDSKGCGGVMRSAPFGWLSTGENHEWIYEQAFTAAGYTHGHPTGKVASGALAYLIALIMDGASLTTAVDDTKRFLLSQKDSEETLEALSKAVDLAETGDTTIRALESLGSGWIAEEALSIGVYSALSFCEHDQALDALSLAVTHGGDSDSTGSICGNILGAMWGETWLPENLVVEIEGRGTMLQIADDFVYARIKGRTPKSDPMLTRIMAEIPDGLNDSPVWLNRYPGN